jgi:Phage terminase, small subunit
MLDGMGGRPIPTTNWPGPASKEIVSPHHPVESELNFKRYITLTKKFDPIAKHLRPLTRQWVASVIADYELEPHHERLLIKCAEAWDRSEQAREAIAKHGLTYDGRFGEPRARPEVAIERDSRLAFCRLLRELDIDVTEPGTSSRPPALRSNRN